MVFYNLFLSCVNVYCFFGFLSCLTKAESLFVKKEDQQLNRVYYVYWLTKVGTTEYIHELTLLTYSLKFKL